VNKKERICISIFSQKGVAYFNLNFTLLGHFYILCIFFLQGARYARTKLIDTSITDEIISYLFFFIFHHISLLHKYWLVSLKNEAWEKLCKLALSCVHKAPQSQFICPQSISRLVAHRFASFPQVSYYENSPALQKQFESFAGLNSRRSISLSNKIINIRWDPKALRTETK